MTAPFHVPGIDPAGWTGIFPNMPFEEYHRRAVGIASAGALKLVRRSLAHYRHWATSPVDRRTKATEFGKVYHAYVLTPEQFALDYLVAPRNAPRRPTLKQLNARTKSFATMDAIAFWSDFEEKAAGRTIITAADYQKIQDMRAALDDEDVVGELVPLILREGAREVSYRWFDPETGLPCRLRMDYVHDDLRFAFDLKTCRIGTDEGFARACVDLEYHVSRAHYLSGAYALERPLRAYQFLAQETEPPYVAALTNLGVTFEDLGFSMWQKAMKRLADAVRTGKFPGYVTPRHPDGFRTIEAPQYAFFRDPEESLA